MTSIATTAPRALALSIALAFCATPALAGGGVGIDSFDLMNHAKCYKIKDSEKVKAVADLFTVRSGWERECKLSKAQLLCVPAHKQLRSAEVNKQPISPDVPGDGVGTDDAWYGTFATLCYKAKCPKQELPELDMTDQFARHRVQTKKAAFLCAPAIPSCQDPTRTVLVAGGGQDRQSCRQFDGNQTACEGAWRVSRSGPTSCFYTTLDECHGCSGGSTGLAEGCTNTCQPGACANAALVQTSGRCSDLTSEPECNAAWSQGGHGVHSCSWDTLGGRCTGCGPAGELGGFCTDSCRAQLP